MFTTFLIIWELPVLIRGAVELMPPGFLIPVVWDSYELFLIPISENAGKKREANKNYNSLKQHLFTVSHIFFSISRRPYLSFSVSDSVV
jgi:hypothetical protein